MRSAGFALNGVTALVIGLAIGWVGGGRAQECVDYAATTLWVSEVPVPLGSSRFWTYPTHRALAARGDTLLLADWLGNLQVIDAAEPSNLREVRFFESGIREHIGDIALAGDVAYLAGQDSLWAFSIAEIGQPQLIGAIPSPVQGWAAKTCDSTLVVVGWSLLWVVDVSQPEAPAPLATLTLPGDALDVACDNGLAHVVTRSQLVTIDLQTPAAPAIIGQTDIADVAGGITARAGYAYVSAIPPGGRSIDLLTFDVTDPSAPRLMSALPNAGGYEIDIEGTRLCATGWVGTAVNDISEPAEPRLLWRSSSMQMAGGGLTARNGHLFAVEWDFTDGMDRSVLRAYRLSDEEGFRPLRSDPWPAPAGWVRWGQLVLNRYAYCQTRHSLDEEEGRPWWILNLADPLAPAFVGELPALRGSWGTDGQYIYVAGCDAFQVVDITDPTQPAIVATITAPWPDSYCNADGPWAWVQATGDTVDVTWPDAQGRKWRTTVNVAEPGRPQIESTQPVPALLNYRTLARMGNLGYCTNRDSLLALDLSDRTAIRVLHAEPMNGWSHEGIVIADGFAYLPYYKVPLGYGLSVFDLTDPQHPRLAAQITLPCIGYAMVKDRRLYVTSPAMGIHIVDIADPRAPRYRGALTSDSETYAWGFVGNQLVACQYGDVMAYPLDCAPPVPSFLSSFLAERAAGAVALRWFVSRAAGEFRLTAERGPESWEVPISREDEAAFTARDADPRLAAGGTVVYTLEHRESAGDSWQVLAQRSVEMAGPARPVLLEAPHPNPFNPVVRIPFTLAQAQQARVAIYDMAGRRVATVADREFSAGRQEVVWRGVDGQGAAVASGSYVVKVEGESGQDARRITLLR